MIPPQGNADFAAAMEQVLDVYRRPDDKAFPVVCMDETPRQLIRETRVPLAAEPDARHGTTMSTGAAQPAMCSWPRNIRQCLNRRIDSIEVLRDEAAAWQAERDRIQAKVNWQFTTTHARNKLKRLYPTFDS